MTTIVWFRNDLRLADNPALAGAAARGEIVPVFIRDDLTPDVRPIGGASSWWLKRSLAALARSLGGALILRRGEAEAELKALVSATDATAVYWNRLYDAPSVARDSAIKTSLTTQGVRVRSFNAALLNEPWDVKTGAGEPYKVFTPYWRSASSRDPGAPTPVADFKSAVSRRKTQSLNTWSLEDREPNWAKSWGDIWTPGEVGACARLEAFVEGGAIGYAVNRDRPDRAGVSRLSPHLHWGELSPRQAMVAIHGAIARGDVSDHDGEAFVRELYWREFSHHLLYYFPSLATRNWRPGFDAFPWREAPDDLDAWKQGRTGYPLVDAGMRELWTTGYMHNRVRMVAASFLVKHLRIHWRAGEEWFWDTLVDADLANNCASWQWVAGTGADAAPYFRIFNPVAQGKKFDPDGTYVRRWLPELANLPDRYVHAPFEAPEHVLRSCDVCLGRTFPLPIVNLAEARAGALEGYEVVKSTAPN